MQQLPPTVLDDANQHVEAMVPEALGLARSLNLPRDADMAERQRAAATELGLLPD